MHYQRGYYNEELVDFEDFEKQLDQNAPEHTLQTKIELARIIKKEKNLKENLETKNILFTYKILTITYLAKLLLKD